MTRSGGWFLQLPFFCPQLAARSPQPAARGRSWQLAEADSRRFD